MDEAAIAQHIRETFENVQEVMAQGNRFFFVGPDRKMSFVTVMANDAYDQASALSRAGVFRVNVGVSRGTYERLFGAPPAGPVGADIFGVAYDFSALDVVMPHPLYAQMCWLCVLNPSAETFETIKPMLVEAYTMAAAREKKRA